MTATKKKQTKPAGGTLMGMRSSFRKVVGTGGAKKATTTKKKWTFQQVFTVVAAVALVIALIYAFTRR